MGIMQRFIVNVTKYAVKHLRVKPLRSGAVGARRAKNAMEIPKMLAVAEIPLYDDRDIM